MLHPPYRSKLPRPAFSSPGAKGAPASFPIPEVQLVPPGSLLMSTLTANPQSIARSQESVDAGPASPLQATTLAPVAFSDIKVVEATISEPIRQSGVLPSLAAMSAGCPRPSAPGGLIANKIAELQTYSRWAKLRIDVLVLPSPIVQWPPRLPTSSSASRCSVSLAAKARKVVSEG